MMNKITNIIEKTFPYFLLIQVLIDVITTVFVHVIKVPISFGMIVRFFFIVIASFYILVKGKKHEKLILILLAFINIYQLVYVYLKIPNFNFFSNIRYYLRTSYYAIMLLFLSAYKEKLNVDKILEIINKNLFLIIVIFIIGIITKTGLPMYNGNLLGTSGWFTSGNEISTIVTILSLISIYNYLKNSSLFNYITLIGVAFVLLSLGTKNSLIALLLFAILSFATMFYQVLKERKNVSHIIVFLLLFIVILCNYERIPAIYNTKSILAEQKEDQEKAKYTDDTEIPESIATNRYKDYSAVNKNKYLTNITFSIYENSIGQAYIDVSGYFYPMYFDVSHPKYIEKYIILSNENETLEYKLTDTYNKYIKESLDEDYNSDFSGLEGEIYLDEINKNEKYNIKMLIKIDNEELEYDIIDDIIYAEKYEKVITKENDKISFNIDLMELKKEKDCDILPHIPLLSGRFERLEKYICSKEEYKANDILLGSGYIKNFEDEEGFEMDIIEIFITYGFIGFIVYFAITFKILFEILIKMIKNPKVIFKNHNYLLVISLLIGYALAALVGHTLLTPASAIYLSLIAIITNKIFKEDSNEKIH